MTSKQRSYLKGIAMTTEPIFQIGKSSVTPELTAAIAEALEARELIKITVLKNCLDDGKSIAQVLAERTRSEVVQVIGKKLYYINRPRTNPVGKSYCRTKRKRSVQSWQRSVSWEEPSIPFTMVI